MATTDWGGFHNVTTMTDRGEFHNVMATMDCGEFDNVTTMTDRGGLITPASAIPLQGGNAPG
jgi:hypothetical protein